ncbi:MAG TPA: ribokinase [Actinomycetota bacterium]|nr:ribokinase [Actinomycetota bacterium]
MSEAGGLVVIGAINVDLVVSGAALPRPGETVTDGELSQHHGGKGGNQATAAARVLDEAGRVAMLGAVGDDDMGHAARTALEAEGIDVANVAVVPDAPTGVALIAVDQGGQNKISVAPGANRDLGDRTEALEGSRPALVLASCEVPFETLSAAAAWCGTNHVAFVLNPAPIHPMLRELLEHTAVVTPNHGEVTKLAPTSGDAVEAAHALRERTPGLTVLVTMGEAGAYLLDDDGETGIPARSVRAVDSTGAGDCLNGVLAAGLLERRSIREAAARAVAAAPMSTAVAGAREGMPTRQELEEFLAR